NPKRLASISASPSRFTLPSTPFHPPSSIVLSIFSAALLFLLLYIAIRLLPSGSPQPHPLCSSTANPVAQLCYAFSRGSAEYTSIYQISNHVFRNVGQASQ